MSVFVSSRMAWRDFLVVSRALDIPRFWLSCLLLRLTRRPRWQPTACDDCDWHGPAAWLDDYTVRAPDGRVRVYRLLRCPRCGGLDVYDAED